VDWASANGCAGIVEGISDQDFYQVEKLSNYSVGPMGGPCYRPWDFEAKIRPPEAELAKHLEYLCAHWGDVAGSSLASITQPLALTGKKARRFLVCAEPTAIPPWGGWTYRSPDEAKRRTFTRFRSAVNTAIAPHEVDHIAKRRFEAARKESFMHSLRSLHYSAACLTSRTCLQLPRQRNPSQVHSR